MDSVDRLQAMLNRVNPWAQLFGGRGPIIVKPRKAPAGRTVYHMTSIHKCKRA